MTARLLLTTDRTMLDHDPGHEFRQRHPESPARLARVLDRLERSREAEWTWGRPVPPAPRGLLELVHTRDHVDRVLGTRGQVAQLDPDTGTSPGSVTAALTAVAHAVEGVRQVVAPGPIECAFALLRPPGHHAEPGRAMGFCLFNNLAIAIEVAQREFGIDRVLVVDWDVHHGNGTQAAFYERPDVLVFDVHQSPHYPGSGALTETGAGAGEGYTINLPLAPGAGDADYLTLFQRVLVPVADAFQPELIVVAAGFDAHAGDPLGGMLVTTGGFAQLCRLVRSVADRHARGRCLLTLEGGYALDALAESVATCADVLSRPEVSHAANSVERVGACTTRLLSAAARLHGRRWPISAPERDLRVGPDA